MKHIPGPWRVDNKLDAIVSKNGSVIVNLQYIAGKNTNLISASPELLEALENLITVDDELFYPAAIKKAMEAIKKARGEA